MNSHTTENPGEAPSQQRRDTANWAPAVDRLRVSNGTLGAADLVEGRRLQGPLQGFGQMWQKTFRVSLDGAEAQPTAVIKEWKENFQTFWPKGNRFFAPLTGIQPGEVALISLSAGPMSLSTGVMVLYADDESFTLMTPQGHPFAGWITFSSFRQGETTLAQVQVLIRAQDPISELGSMLGGGRMEEKFWQRTVQSVAAHFGVEATAETVITCVDPGRKWSQAGNVWHNAGIRTVLYQVSTPVRLLKKPFSRSKA